MTVTPRDEAICGHLGVAQTMLAVSKPKTDAMIERMREMASETKWHGDTDGTKKMLCDLVRDLGKLTAAQLAPASDVYAAPIKGSKSELLPGVDGAIGQINKALKSV